MDVCPVRGTYDHVSIFLCSRTKKALKLPSRATFAIVKFSYLFRISQLSCKFQFLSRICEMVISTISCTCHHEINLARNNPFNNISFETSSQAWWFTGYNIECEHHILWFAPHIRFFFKICQMVISPIRTYNH